jgi:peptide chain release factor 1
VARAAAAVSAMRVEQADLSAMQDDPEMRALAEEELTRLREDLPEAERALSIAMLPRDVADSRPAMLEIRAGTAGTRPLCSPPISTACMSASLERWAGGSR